MSLFGRRREPSKPGCLLCGDEFSQNDDTRKLIMERSNGWVLEHRTTGELCKRCWADLTETITESQERADHA